MNKQQKLILFITFLLGIISPFIGYTAMLFFFILPFLMLLMIAATIYWITTFFRNKSDHTDALFFFVLIPLLLLSQVFAIFTVHTIQRMRSEIIITKIEEFKVETGSFPETFETSFGIEYKKGIRDDAFDISYSRGFLVTEKYSSNTKIWKSYGWND